MGNFQLRLAIHLPAVILTIHRSQIRLVSTIGVWRTPKKPHRTVRALEDVGGDDGNVVAI
jgi:hypothetical protein